MIVEILKIIIPVLLLGSTKAFFDVHEITKGSGIKHFLEWIVWAAAFVVVDWLFELNMWVLPLQAALSWLWFDALLNSLRGLHIFKVGETWIGDLWLRKLPNHEFSALLLKVMLIAATLFLYLKCR